MDGCPIRVCVVFVCVAVTLYVCVTLCVLLFVCVFVCLRLCAVDSVSNKRRFFLHGNPNPPFFLITILGEANAKIEPKLETKGKGGSPANSLANSVRSYYYSTVPMPHSCIAIAVGHWEEAGVVDINLDVYLDKFEPKQLYLPADGCGHEPYPCRLGT